MLNNVKSRNAGKQLAIIFAVVTLFSITSCSSDKTEPEKTSKNNTEIKQDDHMQMDMKDHQNMKMDSSKLMKESIVREGKIDLIAIDENKDGKVYQDMMDWNVISDKAGECPLCGMKLKEVNLEKAKENLVKHGFEVK